MVGKLVTLASCVAFMGSSTAAQAQSCYDLRAQRDDNNRMMLAIAADYPKTHAALVGCLAGNDTQSDAQACAEGILGIACLGMGPADCADLMSRWYRAIQTAERITHAMRVGNCVQ